MELEAIGSKMHKTVSQKMVPDDRTVGLASGRIHREMASVSRASGRHNGCPDGLNEFQLQRVQK